MQNGMDKVDDYTQMPEHFNLRFNIRDTEMVLNLTKNSHILADFPIYIADNGVVTEVDIPSDDMFVMYGDKDAGASVLVHRNTEDPEGESYLYVSRLSLSYLCDWLAEEDLTESKAMNLIWEI